MIIEAYVLVTVGISYLIKFYILYIGGWLPTTLGRHDKNEGRAQQKEVFKIASHAIHPRAAELYSTHQPLMSIYGMYQIKSTVTTNQYLKINS